MAGNMLVSCTLSLQRVQPTLIPTEKPSTETFTSTQTVAPTQTTGNDQTLENNSAPVTPNNPAPANGAFGQNLNVTLAWGGGDPDGDVVTYTVYLEANRFNPSKIVAANQNTTAYPITNLTPNTNYFWQVIAKDSHGIATPGRVWNFKTGSSSDKAILIHADGMTACVVTSGGAAKCWGTAGYDNLGRGTPALRLTPVDVGGLSSGVLDIAIGRDHTCLLTSKNGVRCWGSFGEQANGDLGDPWTAGDVNGLQSGIVAVSAGGDQTCALTIRGRVKCWGAGWNDSLENGNPANNEAPINLAGLANGIYIAVGPRTSCAVIKGGKVKCWGANDLGQLGDGKFDLNDHKSPVNVVGLSFGVASIAAGKNYNCALTKGGRVKCWGYNGDGQLGDGSTNDSPIPVNVVGLSSRVIAIAAGDSHACALTESGGVKCWGDNKYSELGDGTFKNSTTPVDVVGLKSTVVAIAVGSGYSCAVTRSGEVKCWGDNMFGELGNGTITFSSTPVNVFGFP